jgi:hypothetical protein
MTPGGRKLQSPEQLDFKKADQILLRVPIVCDRLGVALFARQMNSEIEYTLFHYQVAALPKSTI